MAHSIPVKFIALCLAALSLLGVFASAAGIVGLTAMDLYDNSVEELYSESMQSTRQNFAVNLAHRYASLQLGKLPEAYLNEYYGLNWMYNTFQYGHYYYTIRNEHGQIVESTMADAPAGGTRYEMAVTNIRYRALVSIEDAFPAPEIVTEPPAATDPTPTDSAAATEPPTQPTEAAQPITVPGETWPETVPPESEGATVPTGETLPETTDDADEAPETQTPTEPVNTDPETQDAPQEPEATMPPSETLPESLPSVTSENVPVTNHDRYYDYALERFVDFEFVYADLPPYTVELYLLPGAVPEEYAWTLLRQVWGIRYQLPWALSGCALLFAVLGVFLCCIAGRKKGQDGSRAGGLNRAPLELHLAVTAAWIFAMAFLLVEGVEYLLRYSPKLLVPLVAMGGYAVCLSLVCCGFAMAAQFKTAEGFWWKNSITGRFAVLTLWMLKKLWSISLVLLKNAWELLKKAWVLLIALCAFLWQALRSFLLWFRDAFCTCIRWLGGKLARVYGLLPLIWQWLLTAAVMCALAITAGASRDGGVVLPCLGICLAMVIYGASAFGILLESARRMSQGDLETKVSDQFLLGAFRTFAGHLNALADVAKVAAQKQVKSERMKTELITNVSHDIKTPLTSIINYVDLLQKPHSPEEQEQYLEVLSRQSGQLKKLIDDLMEMSKASTGNMAVDIIAVNAAEAINQALGEFSDKLEKAQLTTVFTPPEEPVYMKADGRLAWRVMSNLLSNVCKYALPGTRLYIDLAEQEGRVLISLKNISRQELNVSAEELLERFVRGDLSRNTEGSGLGLNIAQSLMELQKGKLLLTVDGDLFKVTLSFPAARIE